MKTNAPLRSLLAAAVASLIAAAPAQASLSPRYLDAGSSIDAYYDNVLGITWLADVHSNPGAGGGSQLTWVGANAWATDLSLGLSLDWRLPTTDATNYHNSEMGALWDSGDMTAANFDGFVTDSAMRPRYWSSTEAADWGAAVHWHFFPSSPFQDTSDDSILASSNTYAMAVHAGDVGRSTAGDLPQAVPEPESILLMLVGLGAMAWVRRSR